MMAKLVGSLNLRGRVLALSAGAMGIGLVGLTIFVRKQIGMLSARNLSANETLAATDAMTIQLVVGGALGIAVLVFAMARLLSGSQARLDRIRREVGALEDGDFSSQQEEPTAEENDEVGAILHSLSQFRHVVTGALGKSQLDWNEVARKEISGTRLKAYIDGLPMNVMTIDRDLNLIYINPASEQSLRRLQPYIPVKVDDLIGTCIDVFHKDPSLQRRILADPSNLPYTALIEVGPETLRLTAAAAFDDNGEVIGAMAAWDVVTEEVKGKADAEMLANVLSSIAAGEAVEKITVDVVESVVVMRDELNTLIEAMNGIAQTTQEIGNGDFTVEIDVRSDQDLLLISMRSMVEKLCASLAEIKGASAEVAHGTAQISATGQKLSDNASQSAASLEEISSTMEEMSGQTRQNAENAAQAVSLATAARASAEGGDEQMQSMVAAMREIDESSQDISKIIKVIDEIAFQTNLLALNAAVEAARAGVHGKGFAVVAEEVRNLAERSAQAAKETTELIEGSGKKVAQGRSIAEKTAQSLVQIVDSIGKATDLVSEIAAASQEQAEGISQVNIGLTQVDRVTQQNTASAEELAAAADTLRSRADQVQANLAWFRLPGGASVQGVALGEEGQRVAMSSPRRAETAGGWEGIAEQARQTSLAAPADPAASIALDDEEFGRY